jgi:glucosamine--fructose-6-phosphate aminotransferase (isomerizing)
MGSSFNGAYPAWLKLAALPIPTLHVDTAELLHYGRQLIDPKTLLWINSQSGRSFEVVRLLEILGSDGPSFQLSMSNYPDSPLAYRADLAAALHAGEEVTVSTKTYINMVALLLLAAAQLTGEDWQALKQAMEAAATALEQYLVGWEDRLNQLDEQLDHVEDLVILGRGPSMAAVWNGSLVNKEAAKCVFEGMNCAYFRHGPLELVSPRLTAMIFEGVSATSALNHDLALEVQQLGGKALWISPRSDPVLPTIPIPAVAEAVLPLVEILPLQLLSVLMARRNGIEPGTFFHIGKVTDRE